MNTLGETEFNVRGYECGPDERATLASVMNYLQEAAGLQAERSGFSKLDFNAAGEDISWIVTRFHLTMDRYPRWHETVRVATWPCGGRKIVANRDFEVFADGVKIGAATSEWMLLDLGTRKIVPVPRSVYDLANDERPRALGAEHRFSKLRWERPAGGDGRTVVPVRLRAGRGDIDINGHVNNVRYVSWLMESLPGEGGAVRDFEIAFKSETMAGEEIVAESAETEPGVFESHVAASDGRDHVVARVCFAAAADGKS